MGNFAIFLIGVVLGIVSGVILGAALITKFNPVDNEYHIGKLRAKKGSRIDVTQQMDLTPKGKDKIFNRFFNKHKFKK